MSFVDNLTRIIRLDQNFFVGLYTKSYVAKRKMTLKMKSDFNVLCFYVGPRAIDPRRKVHFLKLLK